MKERKSNKQIRLLKQIDAVLIFDMLYYCRTYISLEAATINTSFTSETSRFTF